MSQRMIPEVPENLLEFQEMFPTEMACRDDLFRLKWPDLFICPRCGGREAYHLPRRGLYQCKSCGHQVSLTGRQR